jgi:hypothetical protein
VVGRGSVRTGWRASSARCGSPPLALRHEVLGKESEPSRGYGMIGHGYPEVFLIEMNAVFLKQGQILFSKGSCRIGAHSCTNQTVSYGAALLG